MFVDPFAKLCYTSLLTSQFDKVIYIDLDTMFTGYLITGLIRVTNHLDIYLPTEDHFTFLIKDVLASMQSASLVIVDSVNSFYNLFRLQETKIGSLNHLLSVLLMLLVRQGIDIGVPVLATSMLRYKKEHGWTQSPASRRLLQHKSAVMLNVELRNKDLVVKVLGHESMPPGSELIFRNGMITV